jgi:hypothetical protein
MYWSLKLIGVVAVVSLASEGSVRWSPEKGAVLTYDLTVDFTEGKDVIQMKGLATEKVTKSSKEKFSVERVVSELGVLVNGQVIPIEDRWIVHRELAPTGVILSCQSPSRSEADVSQLTRMTQVVFPDQPVAKGKTWTVDVPTGAKKDKIALTFTLLDVSTRKDKKVWKIGVAGGKKPGLTVSGAHLVDVASGELLEQEVTIGNLSLGDGGANILAKLTMVRR